MGAEVILKLQNKRTPAYLRLGSDTTLKARVLKKIITFLPKSYSQSIDNSSRSEVNRGRSNPKILPTQT
ncbi:MAG: hypothetical protein HC916_17945 [Coleofasciculaceae cyanobacterium SM2_1_6]|nr:hypothetical protein [Coleofasciculaceae cyanobacterium SM2_1_6]